MVLADRECFIRIYAASGTDPDRRNPSMITLCRGADQMSGIGVALHPVGDIAPGVLLADANGAARRPAMQKLSLANRSSVSWIACWFFHW